jgi:hypothetical protein
MNCGQTGAINMLLWVKSLWPSQLANYHRDSAHY